LGHVGARCHRICDVINVTSPSLLPHRKREPHSTPAGWDKTTKSKTSSDTQRRKRSFTCDRAKQHMRSTADTYVHVPSRTLRHLDGSIVSREQTPHVAHDSNYWGINYQDCSFARSGDRKERITEKAGRELALVGWNRHPSYKQTFAASCAKLTWRSAFLMPQFLLIDFDQHGRDMTGVPHRSTAFPFNATRHDSSSRTHRQKLLSSSCQRQSSKLYHPARSLVTPSDHAYDAPQVSSHAIDLEARDPG
jgi:hypothetical protein